MKFRNLIIGAALLWLLTKKKLNIQNIINSLPVHSWKRHSKRNLSDIDEVTVHHSGTDGGDAYAFARYHVEQNGWPAIGYHYVIYPDGKVEQTLPLETIGAHDGGENSDSVGVVFVGNFDKTEPTQQALDSFHMLFRIIEETTGKRLRLEGHKDNEVVPTNCPGKNFPLEELKAKLSR